MRATIVMVGGGGWKLLRAVDWRQQNANFPAKWARGNKDDKVKRTRSDGSPHCLHIILFILECEHVDRFSVVEKY